MKPKAYILVCVGLLGLALMGCAQRTTSPRAGARPVITTVELSGTPGSSVIGAYLTDNRPVRFTNQVPFLISLGGPVELEVRKAEVQETITLRARQPGADVSGTAGPGISGFHVAATNGLELGPLRR